MVEARALRIRPQPGPQTAFLASPADICVFGGAAGAGKTWALLMEPLRHIHTKNFGAVIFRRTYPQITNEGGMWDASKELYPSQGAVPKESTLEWVFPGLRTRIKFAHMQLERDRHQWDGSQIPLICFDQLEHFTFKQFFYLLGRNRSTCGVIPYVRATCNPDPDHWLRPFLDWWIDQETGYPIAERSGRLRWFVIREGLVDWADSREELVGRHGPTAMPKSFTFIAGSVFDNKILLDKDPGYLANLQALPRVDRERLLGGNWNVRESAGMFFQRGWFEVVEASPAGGRAVRGWDLAGTDEEEDPRAAYTAGIKMKLAPGGEYFIEDVVRVQGSPGEVERTILATATQDGHAVRISIPQDPGQAGKAQKRHLAARLAGFDVRFSLETGSKVDRAKGLSAQAEAGNVKLVRGPWNEAFLAELVAFPESRFKDQVDGASRAFSELSGRRPLVAAAPRLVTLGDV